jgi:hypothetical protein
LDGDGQVLPRKSATAGSEIGLGYHLYDIPGKTAGARIAHPGGKTTSSGHVHLCIVHKILHGKGELKADTRFEMAGHGV